MAVIKNNARVGVVNAVVNIVTRFAIADRLAVPNERVFINLDKYGNTSAAAVAIALDEANRTGAFQRGDAIVLVVFGAGLTWAAAAIRW